MPEIWVKYFLSFPQKNLSAHFSSIFCRNCQIQFFLDTVNTFSKRLKCLIHVFASNCNLNTSTLWNSSNSAQKALDLTIPAKNRRKMRIIDLNFQIKKLITLTCRLVWNWPSKSPNTQPDFSWNVNVQTLSYLERTIKI